MINHTLNICKHMIICTHIYLLIYLDTSICIYILYKSNKYWYIPCCVCRGGVSKGLVLPAAGPCQRFKHSKDFQRFKTQTFKRFQDPRFKHSKLGFPQILTRPTHYHLHHMRESFHSYMVSWYLFYSKFRSFEDSKIQTHVMGPPLPSAAAAPWSGSPPPCSVFQTFKWFKWLNIQTFKMVQNIQTFRFQTFKALKHSSHFRHSSVHRHSSIHFIQASIQHSNIQTEPSGLKVTLSFKTNNMNQKIARYLKRDRGIERIFPFDGPSPCLLPAGFEFLKAHTPGLNVWAFEAEFWNNVWGF